MSKYPAPEEIPCISCEKIGNVRWVSRATWVCEHCNKDNSFYYVCMCMALEAAPTPESKEPAA